MQQHSSKYLPAYPTTIGIGSIGQNSTFSEHGLFAYQIKGNHDFSNIVGNVRGWG